MNYRCAAFGCVWLGLAGPALAQPALQLEVPFTDSGAGTTAVAGSNALGAISLSLLNQAGIAGNFHGGPGSGVSGMDVALDFSTNADFNFSGGDYFGLGPIAEVNAGTALNYGAVKSFTTTIWFKPNFSTSWAGDVGPRLYILGTNGVTDKNNANSIGLYYQQANEMAFNFNGTEINPIAGITGPDYALDQWYFYAITYDGTTVTGYQGTDGADGTAGVATVLSATDAGQILNLGSSASPGSTLQIGNRKEDQERSFDGWINDFRFYASTSVTPAATAAQIEDIRWSALAPTGVIATASNAKNDVTWNAVTGASGYNVYRSQSASGPYTQINSGAVNGAGYTDSLAPSGPCYYEVAAIDGGGDLTTSAHSRPGETVTPTVAITNFIATGVTATSANLNGQLYITGSSSANVVLYYGTADGGTNASDWSFKVSLGAQSGAYSQTVNGLSSNTTYFFSAEATNAFGAAWAAPSLSFTTLASNAPISLVSVLTHKYDNARSGANTNEVLLTPANVNVTSFARLFTYTVDGYCYSDPLYVANLQIPGQGTHNVVFIATENDTVYAFDADSNEGANGGVIWETNLGTALLSTNYGVRYHHNVLNPLIGITGTPVIDATTGTMYVDVFHGAIDNTPDGFHTLHALNITNGTEEPYSPVVVAASVPGRGVDATNGIVKFAPQNQMNRPALTLSGGILYLCYGSYGDTDPYHGWVIGFNPANLEQLTNYVFATTPNATTNDFGVNAGEGALWMGGDGPCADAGGNLYFETANGSFSANTNGGDYGDSFVKLSTSNGFAVADYFTPYNQASLALNDDDLGSGGPVLLPDSTGSAAHPHLIIGAGKDGTLFLVDRDNMGHYNAANNNQIVQQLPGAIGGLYGSGDYFNNLLFFQGASDVMKAFGITNGVVTSAPVSESTASFGDGYTTPSISANGTNDAIAWVIQTDAYANNGPGVLYAFNATNLSQQLYNSSQNLARDNPGGAVKYAVPVVANGKVYVRGEYALSVFGLGTFLPGPVISPDGGVFTSSVIVTLTDAASGAVIYYTLDGTAPTSNSLVYSGPFTLTNSAAVNAVAVASGAFNSPIASASFIDSANVGSGTGLLGQYWANTTSASFTNPAFSSLPTLVRTDSTVKFNWDGTGPAPSVGASNYVVRWTGSIQPQFSQPYTFFTTADDGARLYIDGQLLVDDWVNQAATVESNTLTLMAQQLYNVELDYYYQNDNGSQVSLAWSSPSTPQSVVPQSQLYPYTNPPPTVVISSPADGAVYTATTSVSIGVMADAPYNPLNRVDFYANGNWIGTLNSSPSAPLYTLTTTGFDTNSGGETADSQEAAATPVPDINLTTTAVEAEGTDWTAAIWQTNGIGTAVPPGAGQTYALVFNGVSVGNGLNNSRVRSPAVTGTSVFPGDALTLNTNTELRAKGAPNTLSFPGVGANPGLILNGGMLNNGSDGLTAITGTIEVISQSYNSAQGDNGGGGGLSPNPRAFAIPATLSGSGSLVIMNCSTILPQSISGVSNTFSGKWIVQCGWLQGTTTNSLGTNSITVDPLYNGYLIAMPNATSPVGPALFEVNYDLNSSGTLTLANGGMMNLHQNCAFAAVTVEGTSLTPGTHPYAALSAAFPNNFLPGGSGSITVSPVPVAIPGPVLSPAGLSATAGDAQVYLSWNASTGATSYDVKRSATTAGPFTTVATVAGTTYTNTGLANGTTYYYVVSAVSPPGYTLTAVATDGSGLSGTSAPVHITVNASSGLPYGLTSNAPVTAFLNMPNAMPAVLPGTLPPLLSETGAFINTSTRTPAEGLIPYSPNTPFWSDGATKSHYMALPNSGGLIIPSEQISFLPTNSWTFPAGTVFVKNFDLIVNETNPSVPLRRLETRLLVRDVNGTVYGVTYKWRPDNSDADLLTTSLNEAIQVTNAAGVFTQTWYYPSPADCLTCHTPVANYVLGVNTRQLNGNLTYPATGVTDNQLRTLNRLGLFYPAFDEANITNYEQLSSLTNQNASFQKRARSYLDANCAQCHQPGGTGITFDARYDTPLASQDITNYPAQFSLGYDNACIIKAKDIWRSMIYERMNTTNAAVKMPTLARNLIDTNAVEVMVDWIDSLPGTPALPPPAIVPNGGVFTEAVSVEVQASDTNATVYYTLDGTPPTTNSTVYTAPLLLSNSVTLSASEFEPSFNNSVAASAVFIVQPFTFTTTGFTTSNFFQMQLSGTAGATYVLETTTNFIDWTPIITNPANGSVFDLVDPGASNIPYRFYRALQQ